MANGPDDISRPRRSTFAFDVSAPVQGRPEGGSAFRGGSIVGGGSVGGNASPAAQGGANLGPVLGQFADKLLEPWAKREAQKRFVKGMTDQMYAQAGEEIRAEGFLPKIFGPSAYEEGAIYYEAQQKVQEAQTQWQRDTEELRKLPRNEVAKAWGQLLETTLTGNALTDDVIRNSMLEASAPMLQSVAKANYAYVQEQAMRSQSSARISGAAALSETHANSLANSDPNSPEGSEGLEIAKKSFADLFNPIYGQDEASYKKGLFNDALAILQSQNGIAYKALDEYGILAGLDPEDRKRLEDQKLRYGKLAVDKAATNPTIAEARFQLEGQVMYGTITGDEINKQMAKINDMIAKLTGFDDIPFYDVGDAQSAYKAVWSRAQSIDDRDEARAYQEEQEELREQRKLQLEQRKQQQEAQDALRAAQSADPALVVAAGGAKKEAVEALAYNALASGDFATASKLAGAGMVSEVLQKQIESTVQTASYGSYSPAFEAVYKQFDGLMKVNPASAKIYFRQAFPAMLAYRKHLKASGSPELAHALAFADGVTYGANSGEITRATKATREYVSKQQPGWWSRLFTGQQVPNASAQEALAASVARGVAVDGRAGGADLTDEALMATNLQAAYNSNQYEQAGRLGWNNRPGTTPLATLMGMPKDRAGRLIEITAEAFLKAAGYADGARGDNYMIERAKGRDGEERLIIIPVTDKGLEYKHHASIPVSVLQDVAKADRGSDTRRSDVERRQAVRGGALQSAVQGGAREQAAARAQAKARREHAAAKDYVERLGKNLRAARMGGGL